MPEIGLDSIGRYRILSKLGQGGMGVVYLAEDTGLARKVALKLLPAEFSRDRERLLRFEQEARAISALNHPNILTIYEFGLGEAGHFIAAEFIEGQTLRALLDASALDLARILDISCQVTAALAAAHETGIMHRDIKPENIMVRSDGYVKVLDFGLAKPAVKPPSGEAQTLAGSITNAGTIMGTVNYMSPEQARGQEVDARTDIFSFGIVLYEMATGRLPFQGGSASDIIAAILMRDPPHLNSFAPNTHPELQRILQKALAKERTDRYAGARECMADLKALRQRLELDAELVRSGARPMAGPHLPNAAREQGVRGSATSASPSDANAAFSTSAIRRRKSRAPIDSIAVLPLANAGSDSNADYLSDGITETIINSLSRLPKLRVMARSTVFRYKDRLSDPLTIGSELAVRAVLSGRLILLGENLVIKAELVDVADGTQLWGEQYKRKFSDIFEIEEEISREIFEKLKGKLSGEERKKLAKRSTENTEAYQLYLKGRFHWNKRTGEGLKKSIEYFQQATAVDAKYALAYIGLAEAGVLQAWFAFGLLPPREAMTRAKTAALRALELDAGLAEAHVSLALVRLLYDWDWTGAESEFRQAIELKPGYATAHHWFPILLTASGRFEEALKEIEIALDLDPLSLMINATRGWIFYYARRYREAADQFRKTLELDAAFPTALWLLGCTLEADGQVDLAVKQLKQAWDKEHSPAILSALGHALALSGQKDAALQAIAELEQLSQKRYVSPESIGVIYAGLGDADRAVEWLHKAVEERSSYLIYAAVDPALDSIRSDPRFAELLAGINAGGR